MERNDLELRWTSDETVDVYVNDHFVMTITHEEQGWSGMETVLYGLKRAAILCDMEIREQRFDANQLEFQF